MVEGFGYCGVADRCRRRRSGERELSGDPEADDFLAAEAGVAHVREAVGQRGAALEARGRRREEHAVLHEPVLVRAEV